MAYKRKTKDCYAIEGNCGYGWDIECNCDDYAAIWNCQAEALYKWADEWRFEGLAVSENNDAIAIFEHEDGTIETLDRMYVIIGKVRD